MATVNLGSIKFNWQGAYAGGTAYAVDDVVSYNGTSYVCILASTGNLPTNATYWNVMAEGGDVATTLTTQGDILYRDGSGLQRLGAGTSGQVLQTGGTGANPSWTDTSGGVLQCKYAQQGGTEQWTSNNVMIGPTVTITPSSASNKIVIMSSGMLSGSTSITGSLGLRRATGTSVTNSGTQIFGGNSAGSRSRALQFGGASSDTWFGNNFSFQVLDAPNTTSEISYRLCSLGSDVGPTMYLGRTGRDSDNIEHPRTSTHIMAMEISSTIL
ncbi:hypothetical protein HTVC024P_gp43 [Pelagibacter phage HTVC024P]|nr:hypothetical protein HTVC024P_gp43 [Pelagibacter phage HTVC024P]